MEDLQQLAQANISMDIDTFTNLNPQVLQVSPGERGLRQTGQARGALGYRSTGTPKSEVCRQCGPQITSPGWFCQVLPLCSLLR